jgi:hypothetical protein
MNNIIDISNEKIYSITELVGYVAQNRHSDNFVISQETKEALETAFFNSLSPVNRQKSPNIPGYNSENVYLGKYFYTM